MTNTEFVKPMIQTWVALFPGIAAPDDAQWALWLLLHKPETVRQGIAQLAAKYRRIGGNMDKPYMEKFASSVMNRITRERSSQVGKARQGFGEITETLGYRK